MILPDVNVLVYAFRHEADRHEAYAAWLSELVGGARELALIDSVLMGFIRIVTNPRVVDDPAPTALAVDFVDRLRGAPRARWLASTDAAWQRFVRFASEDRHVRGNLVPDAWLAALAVTGGCTLATADRGFARFDGLDWRDPVGV
jgi:toxin-antitoxin system PIN domain toxin